MLLSLLPVALLLASQESAAQGVNQRAECDLNYQWASNSLGQGPCDMASYMMSPCSNTTGIPALPLGWSYSGADEGESNQCHCSSVVYSLLSVCQYCQRNASTIHESWGTWIQNCSAYDVQNGFFIQGVPRGTAIPVWAFQSFSDLETFDVTKAQNIAATNKTERLPAGVSPSPSVPIESSPTPRNTPSSTPSPSSIPSSPSPTPTNEEGSSTPVGPIVGGVVGGVAGVAILFGIAMFLIIRHNRNAKRPESTSQAPDGGWYPASPTLAPTGSPATAEYKPYPAPAPPPMATYASNPSLPQHPYYPNRPEL